MTRWLLALLLVPLLGLFGCADYEMLDGATSRQSPSDVGQFITRVGGCGDVEIYASDDSDSIALHFYEEGALFDAPPEVSNTSYRWTLPFDAIDLTLTTGEHLTAATCTDVVGVEPELEQIYFPVEGSVTLVVHPNSLDTNFGPQADLRLEGMLFETEDGEQLSMQFIELLNVEVGWYPG